MDTTSAHTRKSFSQFENKNGHFHFHFVRQVANCYTKQLSGKVIKVLDPCEFHLWPAAQAISIASSPTRLQSLATSLHSRSSSYSLSYVTGNREKGGAEEEKDILLCAWHDV